MKVFETSTQSLSGVDYLEFILYESTVRLEALNIDTSVLAKIQFVCEGYRAIFANATDSEILRALGPNELTAENMNELLPLQSEIWLEAETAALAMHCISCVDASKMLALALTLQRRLDMIDFCRNYPEIQSRGMANYSRSPERSKIPMEPREPIPILVKAAVIKIEKEGKEADLKTVLSELELASTSNVKYDLGKETITVFDASTRTSIERSIPYVRNLITRYRLN
jgi:hypothetical protein